MNFTIRKAQKKDSYDLAKLLVQAWHETYTGLIPDQFMKTRTVEGWVTSIEKGIDHDIVAEVENKIVGFICYNMESRSFVSIHPSSEIISLYVLKDYQGQGIGTTLLNQALSILSSPKIILFVLDKNEKAIAFYQKNHFEFTSHQVVEEVCGGKLIEKEMLREKK